MKLGSLFDGSGTCPLAATMLGIEPVWASEVEPFPVAVTRKNLPNMKHHGNIMDMNGAEVEPVDIITFGSPCQDLSVAGKRAGIQDGERSNLFFEAIRIIKEMREATNGEYPRFIMWENVPGAYSSNKGHDFHAVLEAVCQVSNASVSVPKPHDKRKTDKLVWNKAGEIVGDGYSVAWRTLDAQFWGVPQRRKRIFLVADFAGQCAGEILFEQDSLRGDSAESGETGQGAAEDVARSVAGGCGVECLAFACNQRDEARDMQGKSGALQAQPGMKQQTFVLQRNTSGLAAETITLASSAANAEVAKNISPCLMARAGTGGNQLPLVAYSFDSLASNSMKSSNPHSGCREVDVSRCLDATVPDPSKNQGCITIVECLAYDMYNQASTGSVTRTLKTPAGGDDLPVVCIKNDGVIALQANAIDRADTAGCNGAGWRWDASYTLNTIDRHAVCFEPKSALEENWAETQVKNALRAGASKSGHAVCFEPRSQDGEPRIHGDVSPTINTAQGSQRQPCVVMPSTASGRQQFGTLMANCGTKLWLGDQEAFSGNYHILENAKPPRKYILRRLTPTECARLQGFPDWWADIPQAEDMTDEDYRFLLDVRNNHAGINGKVVKAYTKPQMVTWYNKLRTDSAEYKMWGNGMALPCVLRVLSGIKNTAPDATNIENG